MLLRLRMSPYAYAYRTCKHPCTYACAYACVVRVNQALMRIDYVPYILQNRRGWFLENR